MKKFASGFQIYFQGLRFWIGQRNLFVISLIPIVLDIICLAVGLTFAVLKVPLVVDYMIHKPHVWYQYVVYSLVFAVTALTLFLVAFFVVSIFANLIAFPFNDTLSARTLHLMGVEKEKDVSWSEKTLANMNSMIRKTVVLVVVAVFLFFLALLPGLGIFAAFAGMFIMAFEVVDFTFDHFRLTFSERVVFVRRHFWQMAGFATAMGLTTSIPILNMLVMPGSVVAGACLISEIKKKEISI